MPGSIGRELCSSRAEPHIRLSFKRSGSVPLPHGTYSIRGQKIPIESQSTYLGVGLDRKLNWTAQVDAVTGKYRKRLHRIRSYFPAQFGAAKQMLYTSLVRVDAEYACPVWNPANHKPQKQLEQVQKDFLKSLRLSTLPKGQHDTNFSQYRQHLAEVQWECLWERSANAVMVNAFKIWTNGFPDGQLLLAAATTSRHPPVRVTGRQDATKALQDRVRVVPSSRIKELDLLKVASDSAYVAGELL
ncbi:hypothetical protein RvY_03736 [Ramazzottius varieornatus]|uniref:Uncharacterized protein n=1 Tax=Ramazzottius varieornatus TaxID=947166 RepID=A0A1D1UW95_RAMVA|nr:hypothetical protein RvY_03736 [Ramazzottius varieornatus]